RAQTVAGLYSQGHMRRGPGIARSSLFSIVRLKAHGTRAQRVATVVTWWLWLTASSAGEFIEATARSIVPDKHERSRICSLSETMLSLSPQISLAACRMRASAARAPASLVMLRSATDTRTATWSSVVAAKAAGPVAAASTVIVTRPAMDISLEADIAKFSLYL